MKYFLQILSEILDNRAKHAYTVLRTNTESEVSRLGEKIRALREKKKMSQEELAEKSGISRQTISGIESGKALSVTTSTLEAIAKALGVSVKIFFA